MFRNLQERFFNAIINLHYQVLPPNFESFIFPNVKVKHGERARVCVCVCVARYGGRLSI